MKSFLVLAMALAFAAHTAAEDKKMAVNFRTLTFEEATKTAADEHKVVLIDFYTTWCAPCKMLDAQTWSDAGVAKVVEGAAIALRLDAEHDGKAIADRYKINAYPTILIVKPDGTEMDRLVGYRPPDEFIPEFKSALAGENSLQRAQKAVAAAGTGIDHDLVDRRHELAKELASSGRNAEALTEYLWLFDVGMKQVGSFSGVRVSFLTSEMGRLAAVYPPAAEELRKRRDAAEALSRNSTDSRATMEFAALNEALGDAARTVAFYRQLPEADPRRRTLGFRVYRSFVEKKEYADALAAQPYATMQRRLEQSVDQFNRYEEPMRTNIRHASLASACRDVEVLAGAKDFDDARELRDRILALDNSAELKEALRAALDRAGHPELMPTEKMP
jgi:thiol-disulfide isomerase/thioredoxin